MANWKQTGWRLYENSWWHFRCNQRNKSHLSCNISPWGIDYVARGKILDIHVHHHEIGCGGSLKIFNESEFCHWPRVWFCFPPSGLKLIKHRYKVSWMDGFEGLKTIIGRYWKAFTNAMIDVNMYLTLAFKNKKYIRTQFYSFLRNKYLI